MDAIELFQNLFKAIHEGIMREDADGLLGKYVVYIDIVEVSLGLQMVFHFLG